MKKLYTVLCMLLTLSVVAQKKGSENYYLKEIGLSGLKFRHVGPALMSGRVGDFAVNEKNPSEYYVAVASGGVWKTSNAGTTFQPVFDNEKSYSIGCVTMDPNNHNIVWVGSGENNSQRSVSFGDGVYKTLDGGKTWKNMGLKKSEHIGKIIVHPHNSNIVYVAAQGPLWNDGGDRGLYKTTDGGKNWDKVLEISDKTGVSDIVMDPRNPDVIYATSYQRRRHIYTLINGGSESAIYKTEDGGKNWRKLTKGIPSVTLGRIGLDISPVNPDVIYAVIEAAEDQDGFFRSTNRGESWQKMSNIKSQSPQYYTEIFCDPQDVDLVYFMSNYSKYTEDGGKTWKNVSTAHRHVDDHALWIDPKNTQHILIGGDGGIYETWDKGKTWNYKANLSITQFYRVGIDNDKPFYNLYGGTQDNNTIGGPSRTINANGIVNSDWFITNGGDGFKAQVDPDNPDIVYCQSQYGWLNRFDKKSGEKLGIKPHPLKDEDPYRWNWDAPLLISPHSATRLYFAANVLFRSDDRGDTWHVISDDLTRALDRNELKVMGIVQPPEAPSKNASTSLYGNIVSLSESPIKENLLYVGTDDGLIQVSKDIGEEWIKYESFPDVPDMSYVSCIQASRHVTNRVYASFDNHKRGDFKPYILVSDNNGKSWKSIAGDLPEDEIIYTIAEDHINPNLLFIGTEFGVYFTINRGKNWIKLKAGLPTIAVRDIEIQRRENDLVLATFGRGFYILDNYSPIRYLVEDSLSESAQIFPIKDALMYIQANPLGGGKKGTQGASFFTAKNPPYGATFTYYLNKVPKTEKQKRKEEQKEKLKNNEDIDYPDIEQLRSETREISPYLVFTIYDNDSNVVRRLKAPASKGVNRITWNFRYPSHWPISRAGKTPNFANEGNGIFALPGKYYVKMSIMTNNGLKDLTSLVEFHCKPLNNTTLPAEDRKELVVFQKKVADLSRVVSGTQRVFRDVEKKMELMKLAIMATPEASTDYMVTWKFIDGKLDKLGRKLNGDDFLMGLNENAPYSIADRINNVIWSHYNSTSSPTATQKAQYQIAAEEFTAVYTELKLLMETDINLLEKKLEEAKAPYTPGRLPQWNFMK